MNTQAEIKAELKKCNKFIQQNFQKSYDTQNECAIILEPNEIVFLFFLAIEKESWVKSTDQNL